MILLENESTIILCDTAINNATAGGEGAGEGVSEFDRLERDIANDLQA